MTSEMHMDIVVPKGKNFFLGNNRKQSNDLRFWDEHFIEELRYTIKLLK